MENGMMNLTSGQEVVDEHGSRRIFIGYLPGEQGFCVTSDRYGGGVEVDEVRLLGIPKPEFKYWNVLDNHIKYLAKDANGAWYGYEDKPEKHVQGTKEYDGWTTTEIMFTRMSNIDDSCFPSVSWEDSLMKRPEGE